MQVSWLLGEEVSTETLVGVQEDSIDVVVELGGDILGEELNLVDHLSSLGALGGGALLGLLVVGFAGLSNGSWLNLGHVEAGSEGTGRGVWVVEQIVEGGRLKVGVLLVHLGDHDWGHGALALESGLLGNLIVRHLGADGGGELGGADEGHNVRVVLEDKHLLVGGGFIIDGRSNFDNGTSLQVWELNLKGKSVEGLSGEVSKLELVGVVIELEHLKDLGNDIEIFALLGS